MNRVFVLFLSGLLLVASQSQASMSVTLENAELYQVFNELFVPEGSTKTMDSTWELSMSDYYLKDGSDIVFGKTGDTFRVDATYRESGWGGELGLWNGDSSAGDPGYQKVLGSEAFVRNTIIQQDTTFTMLDGYTFADTRREWVGEAQERWSADRSQNILGNKDHFVAFAIEDDELLGNFNLLFGTDYTADTNDVWLIGFEELNIGDADFNDLVAVVSRTSEVPLPGAAIMFASGLVLVVGRQRLRGTGAN